jgi:hypothetical protein
MYPAVTWLTGCYEVVGDVLAALGSSNAMMEMLLLTGTPLGTHLTDAL